MNWCPGLGTVLANEEVTADGRSERGNFPVFKRPLKQWMMRITAYADRLIARPRHPRLVRRHQAAAAELDRAVRGRPRRFPTVAVDEPAGPAIEVFTTRPDTLFGATYMVLAPEHPLVDQLTAAEWPDEVAGLPTARAAWTGGHATPAEAVAAYRRQAGARSDVERQVEDREKTGVFVGAFATNPTTGDPHPGLHRRLRADGLRHRRHHGGARARTSATGRSPRSSTCRSSARCSPPTAWTARRTSARARRSTAPTPTST